MTTLIRAASAAVLAAAAALVLFSQPAAAQTEAQVVGYRVFRAEVFPDGSLGPFQQVGEVAVVPGRTDYSFSDRSVANGTSYRYQVRTLLSDGTTSQPSQPTRTLTPLAVPQLREARTPVRGSGRAARHTAMPEWDPVPGAQGYRVEYRRAGTSLWLPYEQMVADASLANRPVECRQGRRCAELPLPTGSRYEFRVLASSSPVADRDLSRPSGAHGADLVGMPDAPSLRVSVQGTTPALAWDPVGSARSLEVVRNGSVVPGASSQCGRVPLSSNASSSSGCTDTTRNLPVGVPITYQLRASNQLGSSASETVSVTLVGPVSLWLSAQTSAQAEVSWAAAGADSYDVLICSDPAGSGVCTSDKGSPLVGMTGTSATRHTLNATQAPSIVCASGVCGLTRVTVIARNADGSSQERSILVRAQAATPPSPRPSGGGGGGGGGWSDSSGAFVPEPQPTPVTASQPSRRPAVVSCPAGQQVRVTHLGSYCVPEPQPVSSRPWETIRAYDWAAEKEDPPRRPAPPRPAPTPAPRTTVSCDTACQAVRRLYMQPTQSNLEAANRAVAARPAPAPAPRTTTVSRATQTVTRTATPAPVRRTTTSSSVRRR